MLQGVVSGGGALRKACGEPDMHLKPLTDTPAWATHPAAPPGLSPSRRIAYKATFCRMSAREGIGSLFAKFRADPR